MAVPSSIDDLSPTAASNGPDGSVDLPSAYDDYLRAHAAFIRQIRDGGSQAALLSSVSGADTITATAPAAVTAYAAGQEFAFIAAGDNTGAVTLNISSLGAKDVTRQGSTALSAGAIKSGELVVVRYDGTRFQVIGKYSAASDTVAGLVELATSAETQTGTDTARAVTPAGLASVTATETRAGLVELATSAEAQTGTDTARAITPAGMKAAQIVAGTAVDLSSGSPTEAIFAIPSWAKKITVSMVGISLSGTDVPVIQIGTASGFETSGYTGGAVTGSTGASPGAGNNSTSFRLKDTSVAAQSWDGTATLVHNGSNRWGLACPGHNATAVWTNAAGSKTLSGALTQIKLTRSGTDTFDGGFVNVLCE